MPGLTPKQEAFARKYVETGNASDAYRFAYDASKMKLATINRAAHDVVSNSKIAARVRELQDAQLAAVDVTASDITRVAWEIANAEDASHGSRVSALALLAKRHHEFSDKHEIGADVRLQAMQAVATMSTEQLLALVSGLDADT